MALQVISWRILWAIFSTPFTKGSKAFIEAMMPPKAAVHSVMLTDQEPASEKPAYTRSPKSDRVRVPAIMPNTRARKMPSPRQITVPTPITAVTTTAMRGRSMYRGTPSRTCCSRVTAEARFSSRAVQTSAGMESMAALAFPAVLPRPVETDTRKNTTAATSRQVMDQAPWWRTRSVTST